jgi:NAD(P)-dependent dehydrogenase (short-subunit alcohol dehydrogenase family)
MMALAGKVAVVTGGSRGIGFSVARRLLELGAQVAVVGTDEATITQAAASLGRGCVGVRADVRLESDVAALVTRVEQHFGGIDILINNAGVGSFRAVEHTTLDEWRRVIDTNLTGVFLCTRQVLPRLRARGGGWIINISSLASTNPFADGATYCASKAALNAFTDALMQEVRHDGIRVASVLPGSVKTDFMRSAAGSRGDRPDEDWKLSPDDVAQAVVDLVAHPSRSLPSRVELRPARPPRRG